MTLTYTKYGIISALILAIVFLFSVSLVRANPLFFFGTPIPVSGYLTPGTGTTTVTAFDTGAGGAQGADSAVLLLQLVGSTTPNFVAVATTTYNVELEYSTDNTTWYSGYLNNSRYATTTTLGWQTSGGAIVASTTATKEYIVVPTPTKWVRAIITIPQGSTNGSVTSAGFIAKRQAN
jgi:hypothetical protein